MSTIPDAESSIISAVACATCRTVLPSAPDLLTCWRCVDRLRDQLDPEYGGDLELGRPPSIPRMWALLSPGKVTGASDGRRPPGFEATVPINTTTVSLADHRSKANGQAWTDRAGRWHHEPEGLLHAGNVVGAWLEHVIEGRPLTVPPRPWTVPRMAAVLAVHVEWCAGQDWIADMTDELRELSRQLRSAVRDRTGEHAPRSIGACPVVVDETTGAACAAPLWLPNRSGEIVCRACGSYWNRADWDRWGVSA